MNYRLLTWERHIRIENAETSGCFVEGLMSNAETSGCFVEGLMSNAETSACFVEGLISNHHLPFTCNSYQEIFYIFPKKKIMNC